jgi:hypothetical protein
LVSRGKIPLVSELDFIENWASSSAGMAVKYWFVAEHLIGTLEGEAESSEVPERAPTAPHVGPVEQLEAIGLGIGFKRASGVPL